MDADPEGTGRISYEQFAKFAFDILLYLARERAIDAAMSEEAAAAEEQ